MVKRLYKTISEINPANKIPLGSRIEKFIERGILNGFEECKIESMKRYYSNIIYNKIVRLAEIGKKHIAIKYVRRFEKEIGYNFVK